MGELLLIAVVALLAVGPDRLPQAARSIGRGIRDIRKQTDDLQQTLETDSEIGDAVRELRSAWHGTTRTLPRNRYELNRALEDMTRPETEPRRETATGAAGGDISLRGDSTGDEGSPASGEDKGAAPLAGAEADDAWPPIVAPSGIVARGAPVTDEAGEAAVSSDSPDGAASDAAADPGDPAEPNKPVHG